VALFGVNGKCSVFYRVKWVSGVGIIMHFMTLIVDKEGKGELLHRNDCKEIRRA